MIIEEKLLSLSLGSLVKNGEIYGFPPIERGGCKET